MVILYITLFALQTKHITMIHFCLHAIEKICGILTFAALHVICMIRIRRKETLKVMHFESHALIKSLKFKYSGYFDVDISFTQNWKGD